MGTTAGRLAAVLTGGGRAGTAGTRAVSASASGPRTAYGTAPTTHRLPGRLGGRVTARLTSRLTGRSAGAPYTRRPGSPLATRPGPWPSALEDDAPAPSLRIQLSALQALCRQVFGVRLAVIAIGVPFAMTGAPDGSPRYVVLTAAVAGFMGSYAMLRDWERFGPRVLAHPTLLGVDLLLGSVLLLTASPASPLGYVAALTPLLSGLLYGWRGAGVFTGLQIVSLLMAYRAWEHRPGTGPSTVLLAGFCVAAGIIGVTLRNLMFRFGAATQALAEANADLAVRDAVESERARLAREMHDSVTKTLHGLALSAEGLAFCADRVDPATLRTRAEQVAHAARAAAAESRTLLSDLRGTEPLTPDHPPMVDLPAELRCLVAAFRARSGTDTRLTVLEPQPEASPPAVPRVTARETVTIVAEALENAHRHARASRVTVTVSGPRGGHGPTVTVTDDGRGLPWGSVPPEPERLAALRAQGHFGLLGMTERAASLGADLRIGLASGPAGSSTGTTILLTLPPVPAPPPAPSTPSPTPVPFLLPEADHAR
ncbi:two-component sensor histidine kinase [Streptomyces sp. SID4919]|uniref:sensor histidine kinase n=1 Tax=unclassified Streptomyces TaxID=2593676 RepID=UPI000C06FDB4|nr:MULTISPECIES: histidine kinase [unclassified Streptomyces]MYY11169.1 two-component sensor histidine kinase [Streptomyces sp. SID4919]